MATTTEREYMIAAMEAHLFSYLESRTTKERALQEAKELAHGLSLSLRTTEAIIAAEKAIGNDVWLGDPIGDTIDVGDEDHIHVEVIPSHTNPNTKKMKISTEPF